jgi:DNA-binding transcriptional LysR family regulator
VRVDGQLAFNNVSMMLRAAKAGFGLACVLEDHVAEPIERGEFIGVLDDWCPAFTGYHLYYPSRRQHSAPFYPAGQRASF